jgi:hypothetical protein
MVVVVVVGVIVENFSVVGGAVGVTTAIGANVVGAVVGGFVAGATVCGCFKVGAAVGGFVVGAILGEMVVRETVGERVVMGANVGMIVVGETVGEIVTGGNVGATVVAMVVVGTAALGTAVVLLLLLVEGATLGRADTVSSSLSLGIQLGTALGASSGELSGRELLGAVVLGAKVGAVVVGAKLLGAGVVGAKVGAKVGADVALLRVGQPQPAHRQYLEYPLKKRRCPLCGCGCCPLCGGGSIMVAAAAVSWFCWNCVEWRLASMARTTSVATTTTRVVAAAVAGDCTAGRRNMFYPFALVLMREKMCVLVDLARVHASLEWELNTFGRGANGFAPLTLFGCYLIPHPKEWSLHMEMAFGPSTFIMSLHPGVF